MAERVETLRKAEEVQPGDVVVFNNGFRYTVESVEDDRIGGVRHRFNDDTGSNCWQRGELCSVEVDPVTDYWRDRKKHSRGVTVPDHQIHKPNP